MLGWFAQRAAWKKIFVSKGGFPVDQDNVQPPMQSQILQAVVQNQEIAAESTDRMARAGDAILVNDDGYPPEVLGKHEGLVSRRFRIKKQGSSLRDNAHRRRASPHSLAPDAFVAPAEDGDMTALGCQIPGKLLNHRGLSGASHRKVSNADDWASNQMTTEEIVPVKPQSQGNDEQIEGGDTQENAPEDSGPFSGPTFEDNIDGKLFERVEESTHA
jgi:hypothetical protein